MSVSTIELYEALIAAGVDEEKAKNAATSVISRNEAKQLATKADLANLKAELFKVLTAQTIVIIGAIVGLLQLLS